MPVLTGSNLDLYGAAAEGSNNRRLVQAEPGANNDNTKADFGTNTTLRYIMLKPAVTNSTSATPAAGQNFGWNVTHADMDWATDLPASRVIPAGVWTFLIEAAQSAVTPPLTITFKIYAHRRTTAGVMTELFNVTAAFTSVGAGVFSVYTLTSASQSEYTFPNGETLHVEYWIQGAAGALNTANVLTQRVNDGANSKITLPGAIKNRFPRTHEASITHTAAVGARTITKAPMRASVTHTAIMGPKVITKAPMLAAITVTAQALKTLYYTALAAITHTPRVQVTVDVENLPPSGGGVAGYPRSRTVQQ